MKRLLPALPVLAAVLVLVGCTSAPSEPTPVPTVTVTTTVTATATVTATPPPPTFTSTTPPASSAPTATTPSPNAQQEALLLAYLAEVDMALAGDDEKVIRRSVNQCSSILGGASEESLVSTTKERFATIGFDPTDTDGAQILAGIRASGFCVEG